MTAISKTAAIREARSYVGMPTRRSSTDYVVYAPYNPAKPQGPSTALEADSYSKSLAQRSAAVAKVALHLMESLDDESSRAVDDALYDCYADHSVEALVVAGSSKFGTGMTASEIADGAAHYWDSL